MSKASLRESRERPERREPSPISVFVDQETKCVGRNDVSKG